VSVGAHPSPAQPQAQALDGPTWWLYVLECSDGSLYTGIALDVARRYVQHCRGKAAAYTRSRPPVRLVGAIAAGSRSSALKLEHGFKQLTAREKRVRSSAMGIPRDVTDEIESAQPTTA
jgi:putative endonuclease